MTEDQKVVDDSAKPLDKMTVKELREVAKEIPGLTGISSMKKDDLLANIKDAQGASDSPAAKPKKKKHVGAKKSKKVMTVKEIKKEINKLRAKKVTAQKDNAKNQVDILRRKINRLKKMSRKKAVSA